jgi:hypothetical protein
MTTVVPSISMSRMGLHHGWDDPQATLLQAESEPRKLAEADPGAKPRVGMWEVEFGVLNRRRRLRLLRDLRLALTVSVPQ